MNPRSNPAGSSPLKALNHDTMKRTHYAVGLLCSMIGQGAAAQAPTLVKDFWTGSFGAYMNHGNPGAMEGWGLGPEVLQAANPGLVMLRISGYGQTGPYRDRPGFGVVAEAMGGLRHLTGEPGRVPVRVGVSIGDTLASLHGVIGILMAQYMFGFQLPEKDFQVLAYQALLD